VTPDKVKIKHFTMPELWRRCAANADFERRAAAVDAFNGAHKLRKRGLAMTPVKYVVVSFVQRVVH
jgi:xanthine dehydrogenase molybdopterin-binding subunit B